MKTISKVLAELTTRINLGRQGACARQTPDLRHSPQPLSHLERFKRLKVARA